MSEELGEFEPIEDWSLEGRRRLVEARQDEILLALDTAFTDFADDHRLAPFGFHADDPVEEAARWALDRFRTTPDLDPAKLHPGERGWGLFSAPRFWLAQKVGRRAFKPRLKAAASLGSRRADVEVEAVAGQAPTDLAEVIESFGAELAATLQILFERTCQDIVGYWLSGSAPFRQRWLGRANPEAVNLPGGGQATRSKHEHDAKFRFAVLYLKLVEVAAAAADLALEVVRRTLLSPCDNRSPYRVPDRDVAETWAGGVVSGSREVSRLRKQGSAALVWRLLQIAEAPTDGSALGRLRHELVRASISRTTPHALGLGRSPELAERLLAVADAREGDHD